MTAKKKTPKKQTRSTKTVGKKSKPAKKRGKKTAIRKKPAAKKSTRKKAAVTKPAARTTRKAKKASPRSAVRRRSQGADAGEPLLDQRLARAAGQSGSLQGLSDSALADSESVDELLEEGNAFEADVVAGVEAADNADEEEVHTHEVPEDDVPEEYLDQE